MYIVTDFSTHCLGSSPHRQRTDSRRRSRLRLLDDFSRKWLGFGGDRRFLSRSRARASFCFSALDNGAPPALGGPGSEGCGSSTFLSFALTSTLLPRFSLSSLSLLRDLCSRLLLDRFSSRLMLRDLLPRLLGER
mmetsp:Transcript_29701/g.55607  ORF Transcript_29701/g.55607 Transcript_29701/m.55607 type:complete len:135 (-) Transcript_29701:156-560(-)